MFFSFSRTFSFPVFALNKQSVRETGRDFETLKKRGWGGAADSRCAMGTTYEPRG